MVTRQRPPEPPDPLTDGLDDPFDPSGDDAERAVLGSVLRWPAALDDVAAFLRPAHFRGDWQRAAYESLLALAQRGRPLDLVHLAGELRERENRDRALLAKRRGPEAAQKWEGYCDAVALAALWDDFPTGALAARYARVVHDAALRRALYDHGRQVCHEARHPTRPAQEFLTATEAALWSLAESGADGEAVPVGPEVDAAFDRIDARCRGEASAGLPTGWRDLDELLTGLADGELIIVGARPSMGKTALAGGLVLETAVKNRVPVYFASLEQRRGEIVERLLCSVAGVDSLRVRSGLLTPDEVHSLHAAGVTLRDAPLLLDDAPGQPVAKIAAAVRRAKRKQGVGLVLIDYLQLIEPDDRGRKDNRNEQVAAISRRLKLLAREANVPVVALAQLNRQAEDRPGHKPRLSDLRDSGAVEQDADVVILLHRPEGQTGDVCDVNLIVAKQRNGPTGEVTLSFRRSCMRFENVTVGPFPD